MDLRKIGKCGLATKNDIEPHGFISIHSIFSPLIMSICEANAASEWAMQFTIKSAMNGIPSLIHLTTMEEIYLWSNCIEVEDSYDPVARIDTKLHMASINCCSKPDDSKMPDAYIQSSDSGGIANLAYQSVGSTEIKPNRSRGLTSPVADLHLPLE